MKKAIVALALVGFASAAMAGTGIAGSPHDLSAGGGGAGSKYTGAVISSCQFCHAPHNTNGAIKAPLWNRNSDAAANDTFAKSFTPYASQTLSNTAGYQPGGGSLTCLSCHDGQSNMGLTYVGTPGYGVDAGNNPVDVKMTGFAVVAKDLTNDHPVGVPYTSARGMKAIANLATGLKDHLYNGTSVECGTCHDPHGDWDKATGGLSFLRMSAATLCSECHTK